MMKGWDDRLGGEEEEEERGEWERRGREGQIGKEEEGNRTEDRSEEQKSIV